MLQEADQLEHDAAYVYALSGVFAANATFGPAFDKAEQQYATDLEVGLILVISWKPN